MARIKSPAPKAAPRDEAAKAAPFQALVTIAYPAPPDFEKALHEAQALADVLTGLADHSAETHALAARGVPIFDNHGDPALPGSPLKTSPYAREFLRLQYVVSSLITPEVLADYQRRRGLKRARASAEYLRHQAEQFVAAVDGFSPAVTEALDSNPQMTHLAGLWIDAARSIAQRGKAAPESTEA